MLVKNSLFEKFFHSYFNNKTQSKKGSKTILKLATEDI